MSETYGKLMKSMSFKCCWFSHPFYRCVSFAVVKGRGTSVDYKDTVSPCHPDELIAWEMLDFCWNAFLLRISKTLWMGSHEIVEVITFGTEYGRLDSKCWQ